MRPLAEYAMLGRRQAIIVVLLCGFVPMVYCLSAATVAMVFLRKGSKEGMLILLWAMLPAIANWMFGDPSPLFLMPSMAVLGLILRRTESWQQVLLASIVIGIVAQYCVQLHPGYAAQVHALSDQFITMQLTQGNDLGIGAEELGDAIVSFFGAYQTMLAVFCLMLARWWQASSVNPGGFQHEFHSLKLDPVVAGLIAVGIGLAIAKIPPFNAWGNIIGFVPMIVGLGILHGMVKLKNLGSGWLVGTYIALLLFGQAIVLLALIDSVVDFRKRIRDQKSS